MWRPAAAEPAQVARRARAFDRHAPHRIRWLPLAARFRAGAACAGGTCYGAQVTQTTAMSGRFRGFLPVVVDLETGGFDPKSHAILELAGVLLDYDGDRLRPGRVLHFHVEPMPGSAIDQASLAFTGIDPYNPLREAVSEGDAFREFFSDVRKAVKETGCKRAIVVAHNAAFDQQFIMAAAERHTLKRNPFHPFSIIDTASLAAVAYGHTVLSQACARAGIGFDSQAAHSALYDASVTAQLFCEIVNRWRQMGGWPPP
jgi:ribonuclease T